VNPFGARAAVNAMAVMGIAGENWRRTCARAGTFLVHFLDALYLLDEADIRERVKVEESLKIPARLEVVPGTDRGWHGTDDCRRG